MNLKTGFIKMHKLAEILKIKAHQDLMDREKRNREFIKNIIRIAERERKRNERNKRNNDPRNR